MDETRIALLVALGGVIGAAITKAVELIMSVRKAKREAAAADRTTTLGEWERIARMAGERNDALRAEISRLQAELRASEVARARAEGRNPPAAPPAAPSPYDPQDTL